MARYTGPKHKLARREGINILGKESASLQRRLNIPPGQHGRKQRKRPSEYGLQLREKQKAKIIYGLSERQFKGLINSVGKKKGDTKEMLIGLLETRLDNIVFRLGFAKTRAMARQLVSHGHILVDGKRVNIPSCPVKVNQIVTLSKNIDSSPVILELLENKDLVIPTFVKREGVSGKLMKVPKIGDLEFPFDLQLIIEYYSR